MATRTCAWNAVRATRVAPVSICAPIPSSAVVARAAHNNFGSGSECRGPRYLINILRNLSDRAYRAPGHAAYLYDQIRKSRINTCRGIAPQNPNTPIIGASLVFISNIYS